MKHYIQSVSIITYISVIVCIFFCISIISMELGECLPQSNIMSIVLLHKQMEETKKNLYEEFHKWPVSTDKIFILALHKTLGEYQNIKQRWEQEKENIDSLASIEIASPHTSLLFSNKKLQSVFGFQSIEPWILNNITRIDMSKNELKVLPLNVFIESCSQLKELNAAHNKIEYITYRSDKLRNTYAIARNTNLQKLDLSYNDLKFFDIDTQWQSTPNLTSLNLSHNIQLQLPEKPIVQWHKPRDVSWPTITIQETGISKSEDEINTLRQWYRENIIHNSKGTDTDLNITSSLFDGCAMLTTLDWFCNVYLTKSLHSEKLALAFITTIMTLFFRIKARNTITRSDDDINRLVTEGIQ